MRTHLILAISAACSAALPAQSQAEISLEIDTQPPPGGVEGGQWIEASVSQGEWHPIIDFRIRVGGIEGGWVHPVFDVRVEDTEALSDYGWLDQGNSKLASLMEWYSAEFPNGDDDFMVYREHTAQRLIDFALTGGQGSLVYDAVLPWCQPILTYVSESGFNAPGLNFNNRIWRVDAPLWANSPAGQTNLGLWADLLRDGDDVVNRSYEALSGGAALRYAIVQQSIYANEGSTAEAQAFFNSHTFRWAAEQHWFTLGIQAFAARNADLPTNPDPEWDEDDEVPDLGLLTGPLPRVGVSRAARHPVFFPNHSGPYVHDLEGEVEPGRPHFFRFDYGVHPVRVEFQTTTGPVVEIALAVPSLPHPSLYGVRVPSNVVAGEVKVATPLAPDFETVGYIVLPQGN